MDLCSAAPKREPVAVYGFTTLKCRPALALKLLHEDKIQLHFS